jgi:hypothetical protein
MANDEVDPVPTSEASGSATAAFTGLARGVVIPGPTTTVEPLGASAIGEAWNPTVITKSFDGHIEANVSFTGELSVSAEVDLGPLGGSFIRNPETVDRIVSQLGASTVEQLFELMLGIAGSTTPGVSPDEGWSEIRERWAADALGDRVQPALEQISGQIDDLRSLLEDSLRGPEAPTPPPEISSDQAKRWSALVVLLVEAAIGGYALGSNDPRAQFLFVMILGLVELFRRWEQS